MSRRTVPEHHLRFDLYSLRKRVGGVVGRSGMEWRGPGPGHGRHDTSLSVSIAQDGYVRVFSHAGDDYRACCEHIGLQPGTLTATNAAIQHRAHKAVLAAERERADRAEKVAFVRRVWAATVEASL